MRQFNLVDSLVDIWRYALHIDHSVELPSNYEFGQYCVKSKNDTLYPWEIDILAREVVLNSGKGRSNHSLKQWPDMRRAINHIRRLDNDAFTVCEGEPDVLLELHRIAHRQFPLQINIGVNPMMRAFKIFGETAIQDIVKREFGMTSQQFMMLGVAIGGHFLREPVLSVEHDYSVLGITPEARDAFFQRITTTITDLIEDTAKQQSYDNDWSYTWNPLEAKPLVRFNSEHPNLVLCPIPRYLISRTSTGLFYDLVRISDFDNPFGRSFQAYIGEIIAATCASANFRTLPEQSYYVGHNKKHGVDWILTDDTGHLFIEAKTKRLTLNAKNLSDTEALEKDLAVMANAIVQHYQNIRDALNGKTKWVPNDIPIYPLVLTLEDWFIFTPRVDEILQTQLRQRLAEQSIPEKILEEMPYIIASVHEFEIVSQVIAQVGICPVMSYNLAQGQKNWSLLSAIQQGFESELRNVNWCLFGNEFLAMRPRR